MTEGEEGGGRPVGYPTGRLRGAESTAGSGGGGMGWGGEPLGRRTAPSDEKDELR